MNKEAQALSAELLRLFTIDLAGFLEEKLILKSPLQQNAMVRQTFSRIPSNELGRSEFLTAEAQDQIRNRLNDDCRTSNHPRDTIDGCSDIGCPFNEDVDVGASHDDMRESPWDDTTVVKSEGLSGLSLPNEFHNFEKVCNIMDNPFEDCLENSVRKSKIDTPSDTFANEFDVNNDIPDRTFTKKCSEKGIQCQYPFTPLPCQSSTTAQAVFTPTSAHKIHNEILNEDFNISGAEFSPTNSHSQTSEISDIEIMPDDMILGTEAESFHHELIHKCRPQQLLGSLRATVCGDKGTPMSQYFAAKSGKLGSLGEKVGAENRPYFHTPRKDRTGRVVDYMATPDKKNRQRARENYVFNKIVRPTNTSRTKATAPRNIKTPVTTARPARPGPLRSNATTTRLANVNLPAKALAPKTACVHELLVPQKPSHFGPPVIKQSRMSLCVVSSKYKAPMKLKLRLTNPSPRMCTFVVKEFGKLMHDDRPSSQANVFKFSTLKGSVHAGSTFDIDVSFSGMSAGTYVQSFKVFANNASLTLKLKGQSLPKLVRIDGHNFHRFTTEHQFAKPNDQRGLDLANFAAKSVMEEMKDIFIAYGQSDEYSFVLRKDSQLYKRREAKIMTNLVSLFTGYYTMHWSQYFPSQALKYPPSFDARVVLYPTQQTLRDYLSWRQVDCHINNLYNTAFWALVQDPTQKRTELEAQNILKDTDSAAKNELLFTKFNLNYNDLPAMYKKGTVIYRHSVKVVKRREDGQEFEREKSQLTVTHCDIIGDPFWTENPSLLGQP
ncbi:tRNA-histidine guanylyltransferase 1-like [Blyttiomyces sp. JEL0837]|nr:tRNA-histidine guanylyltransferase 1-like [Blyttiomyces sp. JEL0837]